MMKTGITAAAAVVLCQVIFGAMLFRSVSANPAPGFSISGFIGTTPQSPAVGQEVLLLDAGTRKTVKTVKTNLFAKYSFNGLGNGTYIVKAGKVEKRVALNGRDVRLDIDMSAPDGTMDYSGRQAARKTGTEVPEKTARRKDRQEKSVPGGAVKSSELAREIAGIWWGYSGSTERKIGLCPGGAYHDYTESSYSGRSSDSLGNQDMNWGAAGQRGGRGTWTIEGDYERGVIHVRYGNGRTATIHYRQCGEKGCLLFNGNKLCRAGRCE